MKKNQNFCDNGHSFFLRFFLFQDIILYTLDLFFYWQIEAKKKYVNCSTQNAIFIRYLHNLIKANVLGTMPLDVAKY